MRWIIRFFLFVVLLMALLVGLIAGYGFANGLNVATGIQQIFKFYTRNDLIKDSIQLVDASELKSRQGEVVWTGELENEDLKEASGIASGHVSKALYAINDSGHEPRLFAFSLSGRDLGSWPLDLTGPHDFEDMVAFEHKGTAYLMIADTGDNFYWRPSLRLIILKEPDLDELTPDALIPVERIIEFSYPDGPRDVEGVAVDEDSETVYLLSKRHIPSELFSLPLFPASGSVVAKPLTRLTGIPEPSARDLREDPDFGRYRSVPTAFDMEGRRALVVTYRDAYLYTRKRGESWGEALSGLPLRIPLPNIYGLESGCLDDDEIYVTGERHEQRARTGVYRVDL